MMRLTLQALSAAQVRCADDYSDDPKVVTIARSARRLCPEAAVSYAKDLGAVIRVTDMR